MKTSVFFKNKEITLAGHLYLPDNIDDSKKHPAIVVGHPGTGVKEQTAGLYALKLSQQGFIALAFDASYQGESDGEPRYLEDPAMRVEDFRCAVDYLGNHPLVDENRIGGLGICASGGYVVNAAQTESRLKAVAGISAACFGTLIREGLGGTGTRAERENLLAAVGKQRSKEAGGAEKMLVPSLPLSLEELNDKTPALYREAHDYYRTPRGQHPNAPNLMAFTSFDKLMSYYSFEHADAISPRALLMIAGSEADTRYFSEIAYEKANQPKELFLVPGATHVDLYDKPEFVKPVVVKLADFFNKNL